MVGDGGGVNEIPIYARDEVEIVEEVVQGGGVGGEGKMKGKS